jgi:hypothetical protein
MKMRTNLLYGELGRQPPGAVAGRIPSPPGGAIANTAAAAFAVSFVLGHVAVAVVARP